MNKLLTNNCRVCGFYMIDKPWGEDGKTPTYEICPCCGVEFGNEDYTLESVREYREKWLSSGAKWFEGDKKPADWNVEKQMQYIPIEYKEASY